MSNLAKKKKNGKISLDVVQHGTAGNRQSASAPELAARDGSAAECGERAGAGKRCMPWFDRSCTGVDSTQTEREMYAVVRS